MAIVLEANYAKKLGLPNYSSHQYSVTNRAPSKGRHGIQAAQRRHESELVRPLRARGRRERAFKGARGRIPNERRSEETIAWSENLTSWSAANRRV